MPDLVKELIQEKMITSYDFGLRYLRVIRIIMMLRGLGYHTIKGEDSENGMVSEII